MGVANDHAQSLVAADSLHRGQVNAGLNQMGDGGMTQRVTHDGSGVQSGGRDHPAKGVVDVGQVPTFGIALVGGKQSFLAGRGDLHVALETFRQVPGDWLLPGSGLGLRDIKGLPGPGGSSPTGWTESRISAWRFPDR